MIRLATKTADAVEAAMKADQGAAFRGWSARTLPAMGDAYSTHTFPFRTHLGASGIGDECSRKPWYSFRWAVNEQHDGRLLRLFNRGHLEEARFIAMLLTIGCQVFQQDAHGNQFRISDESGHYGGSGDGIVYGLPDLPMGTGALCEFKTSNNKNFAKMVKSGVQESKWEHYVQMQQYMYKMGFRIALYVVVNKETDACHWELVDYDPVIAEMYFDKGVELVFMDSPPKRLSDRPSHFKCKSWCQYYRICHYGEAPLANCRNCAKVIVATDGTWKCGKDLVNQPVLSKDEQLAGCSHYSRLF